MVHLSRVSGVQGQAFYTAFTLDIAVPIPENSGHTKVAKTYYKFGEDLRRVIEQCWTRAQSSADSEYSC